MNINVNDIFKCNDLALVTTISLFYPIEAIDRQNSHRAYFLFKREDTLDKLIESYYRKKIKVEPLAYFQQLRAIKARLYGDR